ncbi:MAG: hypothetical protein GY765_26055 [bacterium]|nr:hypothetical protein [bacterium]
MQVLENYTEHEKKFYESIGLLVAREVTAEKASGIAGYTFSTYMELLEKRNIHPYPYGTGDFEMDVESVASLSSS